MPRSTRSTAGAWAPGVERSGSFVLPFPTVRDGGAGCTTGGVAAQEAAEFRVTGVGCCIATAFCTTNHRGGRSIHPPLVATQHVPTSDPKVLHRHPRTDVL